MVYREDRRLAGEGMHPKFYGRESRRPNSARRGLSRVRQQ